MESDKGMELLSWLQLGSVYIDHEMALRLFCSFVRRTFYCLQSWQLYSSAFICHSSFGCADLRVRTSLWCGRMQYPFWTKHSQPNKRKICSRTPGYTIFVKNPVEHFSHSL